MILSLLLLSRLYRPSIVLTDLKQTEAVPLRSQIGRTGLKLMRVDFRCAQRADKPRSIARWRRQKLDEGDRRENGVRRPERARLRTGQRLVVARAECLQNTVTAPRSRRRGLGGVARQHPNHHENREKAEADRSARPGPRVALFQTKAVWEASSGRRRRRQRGNTPVASEKGGPAQQMHSQIGKQKAMGGDPADGLQHVQGTRDEVRGRWRRG